MKLSYYELVSTSGVSSHKKGACCRGGVVHPGKSISDAYQYVSESYGLAGETFMQRQSQLTTLFEAFELSGPVWHLAMALPIICKFPIQEHPTLTAAIKLYDLRQGLAGALVLLL